MELLPGGSVKVSGALGERGTYAVEDEGEGAVVTVRLHLTRGPSVKASEYVFSGLVDADACASTFFSEDPSWNLCKLPEE